MTSSMSRNKFLVRASLRANNFARTPRKPNWSEVECEYLLQEIQKNLPMIRSRKPDGQGSRKSPKADMWNSMCMGLHVNRPTVMRSVRDLKDKWKKLQFMAKQHISRIRFNSTPNMFNRSPNGLIVIPKLVYRVLEARGQDPTKLGFCTTPHAYELRQGSTDAGALNLEGDSSSVEQEPAGASSQSVEPKTEGENVKEEITDVDEMYQDESPNEPDFTLQIQSAVSLNPAYNQTEHDAVQPVSTSTTSTNSMTTIPVSMEKAAPSSSSQSDIRPTSFSISSKLLQKRVAKTSTTNCSYRQHSRSNRPTQSFSGQRARAIFNNQMQVHNHRMETSQPHFHQDGMEDPSAMRIELDDSLTPLDELQDSMSLEAHDQPVPHNSGPESQNPPGTYYSAVRASSSTSAGPHPRRLCRAGLLGHVCDDQVVELQREVLREERDKIRLEKEILEMQREKLKLEMMVLRKKVNGMQ